jgi:RNA polymerase sigma-70 factor (ECF subfamily)
MASKDVTALDAFYEHYNRLVFSLVSCIMGNRSGAEDVLLSVFSQVWQEAAAYDASWGKPVVWLLTIARNRAIAALRSTTRQQLETETFHDERPLTQSTMKSHTVIPSDTGDAVQRAFQELSGEQRAALEMAYLKGMSHTQIATVLRQPPEVIKERIRVGMTHLRKTLQATLTLIVGVEDHLQHRRWSEKPRRAPVSQTAVKSYGDQGRVR